MRTMILVLSAATQPYAASPDDLVGLRCVVIDGNAALIAVVVGALT
jgi:hypothetical protein